MSYTTFMPLWVVLHPFNTGRKLVFILVLHLSLRSSRLILENKISELIRLESFLNLLAAFKIIWLGRRVR